MGKLDLLKKVDVKKVVSMAAAVGCGVVAVMNSLSDQKKAAEFEDMKKALAELQNKE